MKTALNIGCGNEVFTIEGYKVINVDIRKEVNPDIVANAKNIPVEKNSIDLIYSSHLLEHISRLEIYDVLKHWWQLLKDGGKLYIIVPDLEVAAIEVLTCKTNPATWDIIYGAQNYEENFHKCGFTKTSLMALLEKYGFSIEEAKCQNREIHVKAKKVSVDFYS